MRLDAAFRGHERRVGEDDVCEFVPALLGGEGVVFVDVRISETMEIHVHQREAQGIGNINAPPARVRPVYKRPTFADVRPKAAARGRSRRAAASRRVPRAQGAVSGRKSATTRRPEPSRAGARSAGHAATSSGGCRARYEKVAQSGCVPAGGARASGAGGSVALPCRCSRMRRTSSGSSILAITFS